MSDIENWKSFLNSMHIPFKVSTHTLAHDTTNYQVVEIGVVEDFGKECGSYAYRKWFAGSSSENGQAIDIAFDLNGEFISFIPFVRRGI